ncbi:hypothetical protein MRB53_011069 [Persea americana]|uniref:Uncharacterized protein n=1 Tax=Persea americana TaxID=3435 RepID=A0ACC2LTS6_PERAE|nr:hypothetical protein MRB53_011069 [Persea americana]
MKVQDLALVGVTRLSLGISVGKSIMNVIVPRNTTIPTKMKLNYNTGKDGQTALSFSVYRGERVNVTENRFLGKFILSGIPAAPKGETPIIVCFKIDVSGILTVSAKVKKTGLKEKIKISQSTLNLSEEEIELMVKNAEKYKLEDEEYKKTARARRALEIYAYEMRKTINDATLSSRLSIANKTMI